MRRTKSSERKTLTSFIATRTIPYAPFSLKHKKYINNALQARLSVAEGSVRAGKTIDNNLACAFLIEYSRDTIHLASGSTQANAKTNIGDCNGFGLAHIFKGRCKYCKFMGHEALRIVTHTGVKYVLFVGAKNIDSYRKILGTSIGIWIATEINEHYISDNPQEDFITIASNRQVASKDPHTLWDLNPSRPNHKIYTKYIDRYLEKGLMGGYNYQHFTIFDNLSIDKDRRLAICSEYDPSSVAFKRNILGQRVIAEGLIFKILANNKDRYIIPFEDVTKYRINQFIVGVDFGGNGSGHAFCCIGITADYRNVVVLGSEWHNAQGVDVTKLCSCFNSFIRNMQALYNIRAFTAYCDSAEQTIINEMETKVRKALLPVVIKNALKDEIRNRIRATEFLLCKNALHFVEHKTTTVINALATCSYNSKEGHLDERLDDGSTDIDSVDAYEYTIERFIKNIMKVLEVK